MKHTRMIEIAAAGILFLAGCGLPPICKSYTPYELDWNGYNSVAAFQRYFNGYEQTIAEHVGDTVRVYGCLHFIHDGDSVQQGDNRYLLNTFFGDEGSGNVIYIKNDARAEIPRSFYDKILYVTGSVVYDDVIGCEKGTGLQLISIDTIP